MPISLGLGLGLTDIPVAVGEPGNPVSPTLSTFTAATFAPDADGVTTDTLTLTAKNGDNEAIADLAVTFTVARTFVDAAECVVETNTTTIEATTGTATISGYVYNAAGTPLPGIPSASLVLASTGSNNTITPVDSVTDQNGRFRWTFSSTTAEAKTLSLTAVGIAVTDTAAVTVTGGGGGLWVPLAQSVWGTATGSGSSAYTDGGNFDETLGNPGANTEVIAAPAVGWDSTNVVSIRSLAGASSGYVELRKTSLGEQAEGEIRNHRFGFASYHPNVAAGTTDGSHHGIQDGIPSGGGGSQNWNFTDVTGSTTNPTLDALLETTWYPRFPLVTNDTYDLGSTVSPTRIAKETLFQFDVQIVRGTGGNANSFQIYVWIYDAAGVELYGPSDWKSVGHSGETMATGRWHPFPNLASTAAIAFGLNGTGGTWPIHHSDQGQWATVSSLDNPSLVAGTSIGPFGSVENE